MNLPQRKKCLKRNHNILYNVLCHYYVVIFNIDFLVQYGYGDIRNEQRMTGCYIHTIQRLTQEFIVSTYKRRDKGVAVVKEKKNSFLQPSVWSPTEIEYRSWKMKATLRVRTLVWMRLQNVRKKSNQHSSKVKDFLHYLQTDLLKNTGELIIYLFDV